MERYQKKFKEKELKETRVTINLDYLDAEFLADFLKEFAGNLNSPEFQRLNKIIKIIWGSL